MPAVSNRAQNYIPISNQSKVNKAVQPRGMSQQKGKIRYLDDVRQQKQSNYSAWAEMDPTGTTYYKTQNKRPEPARSGAKAFQDRKIEPGAANTKKTQGRKIATGKSYARNIVQDRSTARTPMQGRKISARGEMAIPMPGTKNYAQNRQSAGNAAALQPAAKPQGVVSTVLLIMAVFVILSFLLARNASITNVSLENSEIESRINVLTQNIDELKLDIALKEDLGYIQERAAELNMSSPQNSQITYLPEDSTVDTALTQETNDTAESDSSFSLGELFKKIKSWLE